MKKNLSKTSQSGFTLLEVIVSLGLAVAIAYILMQQQEMSSKMHSKNTANLALNTEGNKIASLLAKRAICSLSLQNKKLGDEVGAILDAKINPAYPDPKDPDEPEYILNSDTPFYLKNQKLQDNIEISEMRIVKPDNSPNEYLAVIFNINPTGAKKMFGSSDKVSRLFALQGIKDTNGRYISCYSEEGNLLNSAIELACTSQGGTWNEETQICDKNPFKAKDLIPMYKRPDGTLTTESQQTKQNEATCKASGKGCNNRPWNDNCEPSCPTQGQYPRNDRYWDKCVRKVAGICVDNNCMRTVDCVTLDEPIGYMVDPKLYVKPDPIQINLGGGSAGGGGGGNTTTGGYGGGGKPPTDPPCGDGINC